MEAPVDDQKFTEDPLTMRLTVPDNAAPGTKMTCTAPDGQELRLTIPEGLPPGSTMTLTQDPETKQWRCVAEPAEAPPAYEPPPQQEPPRAVREVQERMEPIPARRPIP